MPEIMEAALHPERIPELTKSNSNSIRRTIKNISFALTNQVDNFRRINDLPGRLGVLGIIFVNPFIVVILNNVRMNINSVEVMKDIFVSDCADFAASQGAKGA